MRVLSLLFALAATMVACGGSRPAPASSPHPAAAASSPPPSSPPAPLPPMAPLPPAPVQTSTVAATKDASSKLQPAGPPLTATQADRDPPQRFPLAGKAGHCYRVQATAGAGIETLDLALRDSQGATLAEGSTRAREVTVPDAGAVCFSHDDAAAIVVSVGLGQGEVRVQLWGD